MTETACSPEITRYLARGWCRCGRLVWDNTKVKYLCQHMVPSAPPPPSSRKQRCDE